MTEQFTLLLLVPSHLLLGNATRDPGCRFLYICSPESLCWLLHARNDNDQGLRVRKQNEKKEFCIPKGDYYTFTWSHTCFVTWLFWTFTWFVAWFCTLQIAPKSLSVSLLMSPSVSLSHILPHMSHNRVYICAPLTHILPHMFPICFQCVLHVSCCCILFALPPNQAVLTVLICSLNFSHTLCQMFLVLFPEFPFIPRVCSCSSYTSSSCSQ